MIFVYSCTIETIQSESIIRIIKQHPENLINEIPFDRINSSHEWKNNGRKIKLNRFRNAILFSDINYKI